MYNMPPKKPVVPTKRKVVLSPPRPKGEKRTFVIEYLQACQEAYRAGERQDEGEYVQGIYNAWRYHARLYNIVPGSASAIRTVILNLKNEGIIEHYATHPASKPQYWPRNYYRLTLD